ncbi:MAG: MarR family transcriptional regulator, partial [Deltaproteobacteria bacterium]|nr:MarR family transcriptional regulator [Deltaproteobacteria bacterium]
MEKLSEGGLLLAKVHQLSGRRFAEKLRRFGLDQINPAQGRILFVLWQKDSIPISELARRTSLGKSTLTSMLDRIEKAGYIRRAASTDDRRVITVRRTMKDESFRRAFLDVSLRRSPELTRLCSTELTHRDGSDRDHDFDRDRERDRRFRSQGIGSDV